MQESDLVLLRPPTTHAHLEQALEAMLACARVLPPSDVDFFITRRLFNQVIMASPLHPCSLHPPSRADLRAQP